MFTITNRLRHVALLNTGRTQPYSAAKAYRAGTHDVVDPYADTVVYQATPDGYSERFVLPDFTRSDPARLVALGWDFFDTKSLRIGAEFAALAAEKVGDPLHPVRTVRTLHRTIYADQRLFSCGSLINKGRITA